jgi:hypothetical protein
VLLLGIQLACGETKHSGIIGQSLIPRYCPREQCTRPFPTTITVYSEKDRLVETLTTDHEGLFLINLKPGVYTLLMRGPPAPPPIAPRLGTRLLPPPPPPSFLPAVSFTVEVERKEFTAVTLLYHISFLPPLGEPPHTGVHGVARIYRGPIFPDRDPVHLGRSPAVTSFDIVAARTGRIVATGTTDATGAFSLPLHPGNYVLVPATLLDPWSLVGFPQFDTPEPIEFTTRHGELARVDFRYVFPVADVYPPPNAAGP